MSELEVSGDATPEEIAALVAVLSAVGGDEPPAPPARVWGAAIRQVGGTVRPAPGAWARSGLPTGP